MSDKIISPQKDVLVTEGDVKAAVKGSALDTPKTITDITRLVNRWVNDGKRPLYTLCRAHGTKAAMTAIDYFNKRLAQYGTVFNLLTNYTGRSAKAEKNFKATTTKAAPAAPAATAQRTETPRANKATATKASKKKYQQSTEIIKDDPDTGKVLIQRHTIEDNSGIVVQYDSYPSDPNKANHYIIGTPDLRMECMS